jgi:hypothetical protein
LPAEIRCFGQETFGGEPEDRTVLAAVYVRRPRAIHRLPRVPEQCKNERVTMERFFAKVGGLLPA